MRNWVELIYKPAQEVKERGAKRDLEPDEIRKVYCMFILKATFVYYFSEIHLQRSIFNLGEYWLHINGPEHKIIEKAIKEYEKLKEKYLEKMRDKDNDVK